MNTLEYIELPQLLNNYTSAVLDTISKVEKKLIDKATLISKKMPTADFELRGRLKAEKEHVEQVAELIDRMKLLMQLMEKTVNDTQSDYWEKAIATSKLLDENKFLKDTIAIEQKQYSDLLQSVKNARANN